MADTTVAGPLARCRRTAAGRSRSWWHRPTPYGFPPGRRLRPWNHDPRTGPAGADGFLSGRWSIWPCP